jgi:hypothetical protein
MVLQYFVPNARKINGAGIQSSLEINFRVPLAFILRKFKRLRPKQAGKSAPYQDVEGNNLPFSFAVIWFK